jgi:hypothetical protein
MGPLRLVQLELLTLVFLDRSEALRTVEAGS